MNVCQEGDGGRGALEARTTGLWCTRGRSQGSVGDGEAGGWACGAWSDGARVFDAAGVARGEMGEGLLDEFGRFDARNDAQRDTTHATVFDVDAEDALEALHPAHGRGTRPMRLAGGLVGGVGDDTAASTR